MTGKKLECVDTGDDLELLREPYGPGGGGRGPAMIDLPEPMHARERLARVLVGRLVYEVKHDGWLLGRHLAGQLALRRGANCTTFFPRSGATWRCCWPAARTPSTARWQCWSSTG